MQSVPVFFLLRFLVGFVVGIYLVRWAQGVISSTVIRLLPLKKRLSPDGYKLQTRLTTAVSILFVIGVALGINFGIIHLAESVGLVDTSTTEISESPNETKPQKRRSKDSDTFGSSILPSYEKDKSPYYNEPPPSSDQYSPTLDDREPQAPRNTSPEQSRRAHLVPRTPFYIQLDALSNYEKARREQYRRKTPGSYPCLLAESDNEHARYKLLIGPFRDSKAAARFIRKNRLDAFPRSIDDLRFIEN